jgi:hypothetical protein
MEFGLMLEFVDHSQILTTVNYNSVANSHSQLFTAALARSS